MSAPPRGRGRGRGGNRAGRGGGGVGNGQGRGAAPNPQQAPAAQGPAARGGRGGGQGRGGAPNPQQAPAQGTVARGGRGGGQGRGAALNPQQAQSSQGNVPRGGRGGGQGRGGAANPQVPSQQTHPSYSQILQGNVASGGHGGFGAGSGGGSLLFQTQPQQPPQAPVAQATLILPFYPEPVVQASIAPSSDNPTDRAYICHTAYTPTAEERERKAIDLVVGDAGKIRAVYRYAAEAWAEVTVPRRAPYNTVRGFVRLQNLHVGKAFYGSITTELAVLPSINIDLSASQAHFTERFPRMIAGLALGFAQQGASIGVPDQFLRRLQDQQNRRQMVSRFIAGVRAAGALDVVNRPDFTIEQLRGSLTAVSQADKKQSGVYIQILRRFKSDPSKLPEIRIGMAVDFWARSVTHNTSANQRNAGFYKAMSDASGYGLYPFCRGLTDDTERIIMEQFTILYFQSYRPHYYHQRSTIPGGDPRDDDEEGVKQSEYRYSQAQASDLIQLAAKTFEISQWCNGVMRPSFDCSLGWNATSPMYEVGAYEKRIWTRIDIPNHVAIFRCPSYSVNVTKTGEIHLFDLSAAADDVSRRSIKFHLPQAVYNRPEHGTTVYPCFEIMLNGRRHPYQMGRLFDSNLAPWSDWNDAAGIALKIQYVDNQGVWRQCYLQNIYRPGDYEGACNTYSRSSNIRNYLLQINHQNVPAASPWRLGIARVKKIEFDFLGQTLTIRDWLNVTTPNYPTLLAKPIMIARLQQYGLRNVDAPWDGDQRPNVDISFPGIKPQHARRNACDACLVTIVHGQACKKKPNTNQCARCFSYGRPCSWTPSPVLYTTGLQAALRDAPTAPGGFEVTDDPEVQSG